MDYDRKADRADSYETEGDVIEHERPKGRLDEDASKEKNVGRY